MTADSEQNGRANTAQGHDRRKLIAATAAFVVGAHLNTERAHALVKGYSPSDSASDKMSMPGLAGKDYGKVS